MILIEIFAKGKLSSIKKYLFIKEPLLNKQKSSKK